MVLRDCAVALVLLTRLPMPRLPTEAFARQARAVWAFPLAGLVVAGLAVAVGIAAAVVGLPPAPVAGLVLAVQVILTGAMHEDGLADSADGLWGGLERTRRLEIMKDSHIGSYGVLALILSLGLRWSALVALVAGGDWPVVIAVAMLSRAMMAGVMAALPNARDGGLSRSVGRPGTGPAVLALALALLATWALAGPAVAGIGGAAAVLAACGAAALARAKIGGQTGDILGATQQVAEIAALLACVAVLAG